MPLRLGPGGLVRPIFTTVGIGVGVGLLLLALTAPSALSGRFDRAAWQDSAVVVPNPELIPSPVVASAGTALWLAVSDYYDGRPLTRIYLAALGDDPPVPPGLPRVPGPGEVAVSPALRRLLESTPDSELGDRFPGRAVLTIGPAGTGPPRRTRRDHRAHAGPVAGRAVGGRGERRRSFRRRTGHERIPRAHDRPPLFSAVRRRRALERPLLQQVVEQG